MGDRYLYKAKRTDKGGWVEGLLTIMWRQYHIINPSNENIAYAIDETTICQYTGLNDKNGKKIWEGDIVRNKYEYIGFIVFEACSYYIVWQSGYFSNDLYVFSDGIEIIGNIFDNPELLDV